MAGSTASQHTTSIEDPKTHWPLHAVWRHMYSLLALWQRHCIMTASYIGYSCKVCPCISRMAGHLLEACAAVQCLASLTACLTSGNSCVTNGKVSLGKSDNLRGGGTCDRTVFLSRTGSRTVSRRSVHCSSIHTTVERRFVPLGPPAGPSSNLRAATKLVVVCCTWYLGDGFLGDCSRHTIRQAYTSGRRQGSQPTSHHGALSAGIWLSL